MKRLFFTLIGALIFSSAFALKVQTEVHEVLQEDGQTCGYKMVHLLYTDYGVFLTYGFSSSGTCCPSSDVQLEPNDLDENQIAEIEAFSLTRTFRDSQLDAIAVYNAGNGFLELKASPSNKKDKVALAFNSTQQGTGSLTIVPMKGGNILQQKVNVLSGENLIEVNYNLTNSGYGPEFYLITLVIEEEVFRTIANLK